MPTLWSGSRAGCLETAREWSTVLVLIAGQAIWFLVFLLVHAVGYRDMAEVVASVAAAVVAAVCGYRHALCLKAVT